MNNPKLSIGLKIAGIGAVSFGAVTCIAGWHRVLSRPHVTPEFINSLLSNEYVSQALANPYVGKAIDWTKMVGQGCANLFENWSDGQLLAAGIAGYASGLFITYRLD